MLPKCPPEAERVYELPKKARRQDAEVPVVASSAKVEAEPPQKLRRPDVIVYARNRKAWNAYMVDWRAAKKVGLTVKEYRAKKAKP